jgi:hypothetical protein
VLEIGFGGLVGHVYARAVDGELPAVIDAADAPLFVSAKEERRATVGAIVLNQPGLAVRVAEGDELLAEQQDPHGVAVGGRQLGGEHGGDPVFPHQVAHGGPRPNARDELVVFFAEH